MYGLLLLGEDLLSGIAQEKGRDIIDGDRLAEKIALDDVEALGLQEIELLLGLQPFGNHIQF